jgi:hypothetical protein
LSRFGQASAANELTPQKKVYYHPAAPTTPLRRPPRCVDHLAATHMKKSFSFNSVKKSFSSTQIKKPFSFNPDKKAVFIQFT